MRIVITVLFLLGAICGYGQTDTSSNTEYLIPADSTAIGTPDGTPASKEIGIAGGRVISDDGRVELVFPAGALTGAKTITIQPTTNNAPNGTGKAYRFEPSGIHFKKPVKFIFHYALQEAETCPPDLMNIAIQDDRGKWSFAAYNEWDGTAKTLQGVIHHFSSYANSNGARIAPQRKIILVGENVNINFYDRYGVVQSGPFLGDKNRILFGSRYWTVNGIRDGNEKEGFAGPPSAGTSLGEYKAPKIMPAKNPVVINLFFEYYSEILKKEVWGVVSCKIQVYDQYKIEITHEYTGRLGMHGKLSDKGSFVVKVFPTRIFYISDISNYSPTVLKEGRNGPFKEKITVQGAEGTIHIMNDHHNDSLSNEYPPEVYFEFKSYETILCKAQYSARGIQGAPVTLHFIAIPQEINFIANGQIQNYNITTGRGETYKLIVTPFR